MSGELIIGIVSGILATVIVGICTIVFRKSVLPWISSKLYDGPQISGEWKTFHSFDPTATPVGTALLQQRGNKVEGRVISFKSRTGKERKREWYLSGDFKAGQLLCTFEDVSVKGYVFGTGVFKLSSDGHELKGKIVYYHQDEGTINAYDFCFKR